MTVGELLRNGSTYKYSLLIIRILMILNKLRDASDKRLFPLNLQEKEERCNHTLIPCFLNTKAGTQIPPFFIETFLL